MPQRARIFPGLGRRRERVQLARTGDHLRQQPLGAGKGIPQDDGLWRVCSGHPVGPYMFLPSFIPAMSSGCEPRTHAGESRRPCGRRESTGLAGGGIGAASLRSSAARIACCRSLASTGSSIGWCVASGDEENVLHASAERGDACVAHLDAEDEEHSSDAREQAGTIRSHHLEDRVAAGRVGREGVFRSAP